MTHRDPFQPETFCDSVTFSGINSKKARLKRASDAPPDSFLPCNFTLGMQ